MKKIISRIFVRVVAVSLVFLNFKKDVFAQMINPNNNTMGVPSFLSMGINIFTWVIILLLFPLSLLFTIIFYIKYFLIREKVDELSKIKTQKFLKRGKMFLIISIVLVITGVVIGRYGYYLISHFL